MSHVRFMWLSRTLAQHVQQNFGGQLINVIGVIRLGWDRQDFDAGGSFL